MEILSFLREFSLPRGARRATRFLHQPPSPSILNYSPPFRGKSRRSRIFPPSEEIFAGPESVSSRVPRFTRRVENATIDLRNHEKLSIYPGNGENGIAKRKDDFLELKRIFVFVLYEANEFRLEKKKKRNATTRNRRSTLYPSDKSPFLVSSPFSNVNLGKLESRLASCNFIDDPPVCRIVFE